MSIGERIYSLRKERGMTQEDVGKILGIQRAGVQKYEKDAVSSVSTVVIEKLAEAFEVSPAYLVGWDSMESLLSKEEKMYRSLNETFGRKATECALIYSTLDTAGKDKILEYVRDIDASGRYSVQDVQDKI